MGQKHRFFIGGGVEFLDCKFDGSWLCLRDFLFFFFWLLMALQGGLLSMRSNRVGHDWSELGAAATAPKWYLRLGTMGECCRSFNSPL